MDIDGFGQASNNRGYKPEMLDHVVYMICTRLNTLSPFRDLTHTLLAANFTNPLHPLHILQSI